ncbi:hypothetical protein SDC9_138043 [bioreactor metagenome]|uniref:Uncharacterized protein n=1 Tax=bioreactor metagenome TaxID=1076179 RepID=A0A645DN82_9ZZZZ
MVHINVLLNRLYLTRLEPLPVNINPQMSIISLAQQLNQFKRKLRVGFRIHKLVLRLPQ